MVVRIIIFMSIAGIAAGRVPIFRMNRASIALIGAVLVVAAGGLSLSEAFAAVDLETLALLFSMMLISVNLRLSGFFRLAGSGITGIARTPRQLLFLIVLSSGILSAFFVNDTVVLILTPLVLAVVVELERNPLPYLIVAESAKKEGVTLGFLRCMIVGVPLTIFP